MPRKPIDDIYGEHCEAIVLHYTGADTSAQLTDSQREILERWRTAHALLRKYPRKHVAAKMLQSRHPELSMTQAMADVAQAARLWNTTDKVDREFLEAWFVDRILAEITRPDATAQSAAQNLKTLKDYILAMPPMQADPRIMEKNAVSITLNIGGRSATFSEDEMRRMPPALRERILAGASAHMDEEAAQEIMDT